MNINFASFVAGVVWIVASIVVSSVVSSLMTDAVLKQAIRDEIKAAKILERITILEEHHLNTVSSESSEPR